MKIIGITGKSGTGKTKIASLLSQKLNCKHVDIDKIGHLASSNPEILAELCQKFGNEILDENNNLDRKKLGNIVFSQENDMRCLSDLTINFIYKNIDEIISLENNQFIILEWILLPNSKYWENCDCKVLITSNDIIRKQKVLKRDNISEEYFNKRDSASLNYSPYSFDCIFENDYQEETIEKILNKIIDMN